MTRNVIGLLGIGFFIGIRCELGEVPLVQVEDVVTDRGWPILGSGKRGKHGNLASKPLR